MYSSCHMMDGKSSSNKLYKTSWGSCVQTSISWWQAHRLGKGAETGAATLAVAGPAQRITSAEGHQLMPESSTQSRARGKIYKQRYYSNLNVFPWSDKFWRKKNGTIYLIFSKDLMSDHRALIKKQNKTGTDDSDHCWTPAYGLISVSSN